MDTSAKWLATNRPSKKPNSVNLTLRRAQGAQCRREKTPKETTYCRRDRDRNQPFTIIESEEAPGPVRVFSWPKLNHPREIPSPRGIKARLPTETPASNPQTSETHSGILDRHLAPFWGLPQGKAARLGPGPGDAPGRRPPAHPVTCLAAAPAGI